LRLNRAQQLSYAGIPARFFSGPQPLQFERFKLLLIHFKLGLPHRLPLGQRISGHENRTLDTNANPAPIRPSPSSTNSIAPVSRGNPPTPFEPAPFRWLRIRSRERLPELITGFTARRNNQAGFLRCPLASHTAPDAQAPVRVPKPTPRSALASFPAPASFTLSATAKAFGRHAARAFPTVRALKEPGPRASFGSDPCFPGNSTLRPERSQTYDAGIDQFLAADRLRLSATYFNNRFRDLVSFVFDFKHHAGLPDRHWHVLQHRSRSRPRHQSLRRISPPPLLSVNGNYSHDDSRVLKSSERLRSRPAFPQSSLRRRLTSGSLILNTSYRRWNLNLSGYVTGIRTDSDFLGLGIAHNPGYARFDLRNQLPHRARRLLHGRVTNLFDKQYQDAVGFPALGPQFSSRPNYRFCR